MKTEFVTGDCLEVMQDYPSNSFDLVLCSPPYENARTYDIGFSMSGNEWVEWAAKRYLECERVSKGLVAWVVEGRTRKFQWSATPALLMAELHRQGVRLRKPPVFHRHGIPGSGGTDWLRNDYEFIICSSKGRLPWSDNTAMGKPPKWKPGGNPSHRMPSGRRVHSLHKKRTEDGVITQGYSPPKLANPGNVIKRSVGKGHMGNDLAHENEAPFPESLAEFFIRSFCPEGGWVLDPFSGSGTTIATAKKLKRNGIGIDIRETQTKIGNVRVS